MSEPDTPRGSVTWVVGRPASGKTTVARAALELLRRHGMPRLWLDSDDLRPILTPDAQYGAAERDQFYTAVAHIARLAWEGGVHVVISATASKRAYRDALRAEVSSFLEVYLTAGTAELERRDPKGLYARAQAGQIDNLPGYGGGFEAPESPELTIDTEAYPPDAAGARLASLIRERLGLTS